MLKSLFERKVSALHMEGDNVTALRPAREAFKGTALPVDDKRAGLLIVMERAELVPVIPVVPRMPSKVTFQVSAVVTLR